MQAMGVLPWFAGVAVHDAWAPYDTYAAPDHQLCCARPAQTAGRHRCRPGGKWRWATQAAKAITAMHDLVREAISQGRHPRDL
jgi:transposase